LKAGQAQDLLSGGEIPVFDGGLAQLCGRAHKYVSCGGVETHQVYTMAVAWGKILFIRKKKKRKEKKRKLDKRKEEYPKA